MNIRHKNKILPGNSVTQLLFIVLTVFAVVTNAYATEPLSSWNEGETKNNIVKFVKSVTDETSDKFIPEDERIAVFDNDGTLWAEKPAYFQLLFAIDRVKELAPQHPEWKTTEPYASVLEGDMKGVAASGEKGILEIVAATHAGTTTEEFSDVVKKWIDTAKHPKYKRPYTELVYQPMVELLDYLRVNGIKTFIVSGGGIEFMRVFSQEVYGIPPEQVIGSSIKTLFQIRDGKPVLERLAEIDFIDDKAGKPVGINKFIGRKPILAFGNSDGDLQMLQYTDSGDIERLMLILHHDDAEREYAYDRKSHIGKLDKALDEAKKSGWTVVSMKKDFKKIFKK